MFFIRSINSVLLFWSYNHCCMPQVVKAPVSSKPTGFIALDWYLSSESGTECPCLMRVGTEKNSHKQKIALRKYLANAIFGQFISLLRFALCVF